MWNHKDEPGNPLSEESEFENSADPSPASKRFVWFIAIWGLSVLALALLTYALRLFFNLLYA